MVTKSPMKYSTLASALAAFALFALTLFGVQENTLAWHRPVVIAHRGGLRGVENTLPAMEQAIILGVDYIEVDVCLSKDGVPVVFHDDTLYRLTGASGSVADYFAAELKNLTLRQNGYTGRIPTLQQVIDHCRSRVRLLIELKGVADEALLMETVGGLLVDNGYFDECIVMSQNLDIVNHFKSMYPQANTCYCRYSFDDNLNAEQLQATGIDYLVVEAGKTDKALIDSVQSLGLPVFVCTVNDRNDMRAFFDMGAAGVVTDYPDIALTVIEDIMLDYQSGSLR